jgi:hypothetical protein
MRRPIVGIMGAGRATARDLRLAEELGELVARHGWIVLTGGRPDGVMDAASRGAHRVEGSLVLGILPDERGGVSEHVDVAVFTGMGNARNVVNVLTSDIVIACGAGGSGTASEAALALKTGKPLILLAPTPEAEAFFRTLGDTVLVARDAHEAIELARGQV